MVDADGADEGREFRDFSGAPELLRTAMGRVASLDFAGVRAGEERVNALAAQVSGLQLEHTTAQVEHTARLAAHRQALHHARLDLVYAQDSVGGAPIEVPIGRTWWEAAIVLADDGLTSGPARDEARLAEALRLAEVPPDTPVIIEYPNVQRSRPSAFGGRQTAAYARIGLIRGGLGTGITIECHEGRPLEHSLAGLVTRPNRDAPWQPGHRFAFGIDEITRLTQRELETASAGDLEHVPRSIASLSVALRDAGLSLNTIGHEALVRPYVAVALANVGDPTKDKAAATDLQFILNHRELDKPTLDILYDHLIEGLTQRMVHFYGRREVGEMRTILEGKVRSILIVWGKDADEKIARQGAVVLINLAKAEAKLRRAGMKRAR